MRVVFMGTPDFAVPTLEKIISDGHGVVGVVTQPDKCKDRGMKVCYSAVKECALKYNLNVLIHPLNIFLHALTDDYFLVIVPFVVHIQTHLLSMF